MLASTVSTKLCRVCQGSFLPFLSTQTVCGVKCARKVPVLARKAAAADKRKAKERLDSLRPLSYWKKQAQSAVNAWIKWRDREKPCISCGQFVAEKWNGQSYDAGHFVSVGARPELRFDEANIHRQCVKCNQYLGGNAALYRVGLVARIGQSEVDRLEGPHPPLRLRADELKAIRDRYRSRLRAEQRENE